MADAEQRLSGLIQKLCNKRETGLEPSGLLAVKSLCRQSDDNVIAAWEALWVQLRASHAQTRLLALSVCEQLFKRSRAFRLALLGRLSQFMEAVLGFRDERPLPPPAQAAASLREEALGLLEAWAVQYGNRHKQLPLAVRYLRETLQYQIPDGGRRAAAAEAEARAREERQQGQLRQRLVALLGGEWREGAGEARRLLLEIDECFELLEEERSAAAQLANVVPQQGAAQQGEAQQGRQERGEEEAQRGGAAGAGGDELDWEDVAPGSDLQQQGPAEQQHEGLAAYAGLADDPPGPGSSAAGEAAAPPAGVPESQSSAAAEVGEAEAVLLETLAGLYRQLVNRALPQIQDWLSVLGRVHPEGPADEQQRQHLLRSGTELRGRLAAAKARCDAEALDLEALLLRRHRREQAATAAQAAAPADQQQHDSAVAAALQDAFGESDSDAEGRSGHGPAQQQRRRLRPQQDNQSEAVVDNPYKRLVDPTMPQPRSAAQQVRQTQPAAAPPSQPQKQAQRSGSLPEEVRRKLAAQAPVLPSGTHTTFWDSKSVPTFVSGHGLEVSNHWGPVDVHTELPPERVEELFLLPMPASSYQSRAQQHQQQQQQQQQQERQQRQQQQGHQGQREQVRGVDGEGAAEQSERGGGGGSPAAVPNQQQQQQPQQQLQWPARQQQGAAGTSAAGTSAAHAAAAADGDGLTGRAAKRARRAEERAYNEAVIGGALSDEAMARQLQEAEQAQAAQQDGEGQAGGRRGRQPKKRMSVKDRLAQKLLRGGAAAAVLRDAQAVEGEMRREREANRW